MTRRCSLGPVASERVSDTSRSGLIPQWLIPQWLTHNRLLTDQSEEHDSQNRSALLPAAMAHEFVRSEQKKRTVVVICIYAYMCAYRGCCLHMYPTHSLAAQPYACTICEPRLRHNHMCFATFYCPAVCARSAMAKSARLNTPPG